MVEFISEPIYPAASSFDAPAMGRGEPGLPVSFHWRGRDFAVVARLEQWKGTSSEGGRAGGEVYLRRHYYRLRMSDGSVWTVYFVRQTPQSGSPKTRWFLYTIARDEPNGREA